MSGAVQIEPFHHTGGGSSHRITPRVGHHVDHPGIIGQGGNIGGDDLVIDVRAGGDRLRGLLFCACQRNSTADKVGNVTVVGNSNRVGSGRRQVCIQHVI